jgi:hypothetical protein
MVVVAAFLSGAAWQRLQYETQIGDWIFLVNRKLAAAHAAILSYSANVARRELKSDDQGHELRCRP